MNMACCGPTACQVMHGDVLVRIKTSGYYRDAHDDVAVALRWVSRGRADSMLRMKNLRQYCAAQEFRVGGRTAQRECAALSSSP